MVSFSVRIGLLVAGLLLFIVTPLAAAAGPVDIKTWLDAVLQTHPELKAADANVAAAQARAEGLGQPLYNPELSLDGESATSQSLALGLSQTFDTSGKRSARAASGRAALAVAVAERAALRQKLASEMLKALAEFHGRRTIVSLSQQRLEVVGRFADIADHQYKAGDTGVLDRDLAALAYAEATSVAGRAELELLKTQQALDAATGNADLTPPELPAQPPAPDRHARNHEALAEALPAIRAALAKANAADAEIDIARSQTHADPTVGLRAGRDQDRGGGNTVALIGLQVSIPLFVRNDFRAEVGAAGAQASAARIEADAGYRLALQRLKATEVQYGRAADAWQRWTLLAFARFDSSIELLDKVWRVHEIGTSEYLVQLRQLLDSRAAGEELRTQVWLSWMEWLDASGQWQAWLDDTASTPAPTPTAAAGN